VSFNALNIPTSCAKRCCNVSFRKSLPIQKMLQRQLQEVAANPSEIASLDYKALIREAAKFQLITHPENWFEYRRKRNLTSHTYNENTAEDVALSALHFLQDAQDLLTCLQKL